MNVLIALINQFLNVGECGVCTARDKGYKLVKSPLLEEEEEEHDLWAQGAKVGNKNRTPLLDQH